MCLGVLLEGLNILALTQVLLLHFIIDRVLMAWKGSGDNHIWYSYYTDQTGWIPQEPAINGRTYFDTIPSGSL